MYERNRRNLAKNIFQIVWVNGKRKAFGSTNTLHIALGILSTEAFPKESEVEAFLYENAVRPIRKFHYFPSIVLLVCY